MSYFLRGITVLSGSGTYTPPAGVTALLVRMLGGAGGGGGTTSGIAVLARAGGGGGGAYSERLITLLASSYSYSVGAAGTGGPNSGTNGNPGGNTTFGSLVVNGGGGGISTSSVGNTMTAGVDGGAAGTGGDINAKGDNGEQAVGIGGIPQSGGGAHSPLGTVAQCIINITLPGNPGQPFSGAGSGSISNNNSRAGGDGTPGTIIIHELEGDTPFPVPPTVPSLGGVSGGIPFQMNQNTIYACPPNAFYIFYHGTAPEISNDGLAFTPVPSSNIVASAFIRSTGTDTVVTFKKAKDKGGKKK